MCDPIHHDYCRTKRTLRPQRRKKEMNLTTYFRTWRQLTTAVVVVVPLELAAKIDLLKSHIHPYGVHSMVAAVVVKVVA